MEDQRWGPISFFLPPSLLSSAICSRGEFHCHRAVAAIGGEHRFCDVVEILIAIQYLADRRLATCCNTRRYATGGNFGSRKLLRIRIQRLFKRHGARLHGSLKKLSVSFTPGSSVRVNRGVHK
ncbi:hypothetical protein KCP69_16810 [Salmonella enterica subsp. enterica]|nr:hypothetical protein KCP69_16810 [Salmonella enterica subsp. enterica]